MFGKTNLGGTTHKVESKWGSAGAEVEDVDNWEVQF